MFRWLPMLLRNYRKRRCCRKMGSITVNLANGQTQYFSNAGYSVYKGSLYVWAKGVKRKGSKPLAKFALSTLRPKPGAWRCSK